MNKVNVALTILLVVAIAGVLIIGLGERQSQAPSEQATPAPTAGDLPPAVATDIARLHALKASLTATAVAVPTATESASGYQVVECREPRPLNGALIRFLSPTTSRECARHNCRNQGSVVVGSVRPLEEVVLDGYEYWYRFSYLPLEGKDYNLLYPKKTTSDGEVLEWGLEEQWVEGSAGVEFECVVVE